MPTDRWEWLEGLRPQTTTQWAIDQMARILQDELASWPPAVDWSDSVARQRFAPLFVADAPTPSRGAVEQAILRARWELTHELDALEHYQRNRLLQQRCPDELDQLASLFIETFITEALFELMERTDHRIKRRHAVDCLHRLERLLARRS